MTSYSPPHDVCKQYNSSKKKSRNIHHEIAVDAKYLSVQRFREKVSMLQVRPQINDPKLPVRYTFPNEMVPDVDMLRIRCDSGIIRQVQRPYVILVNRGAPYVTIRKDKIPDVTQENRLFQSLGHRNILRLRREQSHTLLCPREKRNATTSTHHNTARNRFPVSSPAGVVRIHIHFEPKTPRAVPR